MENTTTEESLRTLMLRTNEGKGTYTEEFLNEVQGRILSDKLIVEIHPVEWFGGVSACVYDHPHYPGMPPLLVGSLIHDRFPGNKPPGQVKPSAWEFLEPLVNRKENLEYLTKYGLGMPRPKFEYDY